MIKLVNVSKYYSSSGTVALGLRKVNLEMHVNEFIGVVGESGSGKTTLLNVICGIDSYEEGEIYLNGEETSYFSTSDMENFRKQYVAFVFQNYNLIESFTVRQNVEMPMLLSGVKAKEAKHRALEIIKRVGLEKHINHKASKLSGGQKQRAVIARALAKDCPIIAADEPTGNLDSETAKEIIKLLYEISQDKLVIVVTHDYQQIKEYASRRIRIYDGEIVEDIEIKQQEKKNLPAYNEEQKGIRLQEHIKMAFKTLFSSPKKTILLTAVFFVFSFIIALAYGTFNLALSGDESMFYFAGEEYFVNKSVSRLVINKSDRSPFSQADITEIENLNLVKTVVVNDYVMDFESRFKSRDSFPELSNTSNYIYIKFLPITVLKNQNQLDESLLLKGRLPLEPGEVVIALPKAEIEDENYETFYLDQFYDIYGSAYQDSGNELKYKIVGIVSSKTILMDEDFYLLLPEGNFQNLTKVYYLNVTSKIDFITTPRQQLSNYYFYEYFNYNNGTFLVEDTLNDNQVIFPKSFEGVLCMENNQECPANITIKIIDAYRSVQFDFDDISFSNASGAILISNDVYQDIFYDEVYQLSVITNSEININTLINNLERIKINNKSKYHVIYPMNFEVLDDWYGVFQFFIVLGLLIVLLTTILGSTLLSFIIFRMIINTKLHDYTIFRTVGANQKMIRTLIYFENALVVTFSFLIFLGFSVGIKNAKSITDISFLYGMKVFTFGNYLVFYGIVLLISFFISTRYLRKVFVSSVQTSLKVE